jgi:hypothetical protein
MYGIFMRENREIPRLARPADLGSGHSGNAEASGNLKYSHTHWLMTSTG